MRGAKIMGSFITGYSGGLTLTVPLFSDFSSGSFDISSIILFPIFPALIAALPQLGKVLNEISRGDM